MKIRLLLLTVGTFSLCQASAQGAKPSGTNNTLMTVGNMNVDKSEFLRMYTKNINNQKPDFSEKALREYVTLYSRFKMKVAEADKMQLDTLPNIQGELGGYKKQLSKTYLNDKEVTDRLVKEAYERMKKDIRVSHILIGLPRGTDDTLVALRRIDSIYNAIQQGSDFETLARKHSDDKQSGVNGGDIGFVTVLQLLYPFESAAYNTPIGVVSKPFRTLFGYHILKRTDERPARGEIQVSQILVTVKKSEGAAGEQAAKARIDSVYQMLKQGQTFESLVSRYSEDKFSKNTQGQLAPFGVGQMVPEFENAAFALRKPGDFSEPIRSEYGYHIIKLTKKTPLRPFDSLRNELTKRVEKDSRIETAKQEFTQKIKTKVGYQENPQALTELLEAIPDSVLRNGSFKGDAYGNMVKPLFTMKDVTFTQADFATYIETFTRGKIYGPKESTLRSLFRNYSDKVLMEYQENKLVDENEDYRNLLNEYRDGVMLFELTDRMVWGKASTDSAGLEKFYQQTKQKYMWQPAISGDIFKAVDESYAQRVVQALQNPEHKTLEEIVKAANGDGAQDKVFYETGKFEKTRFPASVKLIAGSVTQPYKLDDGQYAVVRVKEVFNTPTQKTLAEAKGYVVSSYQEYLEKEWIKEMEARYPVKVNEPVLRSLIRK